MIRFQDYQTSNNSQFELIEKEKNYQKYLERIENIVNRKYKPDTSSIEAMKNFRLHKQLARKKSTKEWKAKVNLQNVSLHDRIVMARKRDNAHSQYQSIDVSGVRRKQLQKINEQNIRIGLRLSELYQSKRKIQQGSKISRHRNNISVYVKDRNLPLLVLSKEKKEDLQNNQKKQEQKIFLKDKISGKQLRKI